MTNIIEVVDRYCSYPKGHPICTRYINTVIDCINLSFKYGEITYEKTNELKNLVRRQIDTINPHKLTAVINKFQMYKRDSREVRYFIGDVRLDSLLQALELSTNILKEMTTLFHNKVFTRNSPQIRAFLADILVRIKKHVKERDTAYWEYVDLYKFILVNLLRNDYIDRGLFTTEISILKLLIREEIELNDTLGLEDLAIEGIPKKIKMEEKCRVKYLECLLLFLDSTTDFVKEFKGVMKEHGASFDEYSLLLVSTIRNAKDSLLNKLHNRYQSSIIQTYEGYRMKMEDCAWYCFIAYPVYCLELTYNVLLEFVNKFKGEGIVAEIMYMVIDSIKQVKGHIPVEKLKQEITNICLENLIKLTEFNIIQTSEIEHYLKIFEEAYDKYWEEAYTKWDAMT